MAHIIITYIYIYISPRKRQTSELNRKVCSDAAASLSSSIGQANYPGKNQKE